MPSRWLTVPLLALLPLVWRAALVFAQSATGDRRLSRFLAPGVALALWLLGIHTVGLLTHSFYAGLWVGTTLPAALGAASLLGRSHARTIASPGSSALGMRLAMGLGMAAAVVLMLGTELHYSKHDECLISGHISVPAELLNGIYPPRHLTFPNYELRYHYAIDVAAAAVSAVLGRLDLQITVHLLALALWGYTFCLYWLVGERIIGGPASGPVTATCVLFAGGAPIFGCPTVPLVRYLTSMCVVGGTWVTPPFASNFLQHPWSLGMPLFAAMLLVLTRLESGTRAAWGWLLLSLLTIVLAMSQVVLFVCWVPSLVAAGSFQGRRLSLAKLRRWLAWGAAMFIASRELHGFFAHVAEPSLGRIEFHPFWRDVSAQTWLAWHANSFGALLPLGLLGFFFLRRFRVLFGVMAAGSLLVRDLFRYSLTWDIVKFSMVTQIVLAILAAAALTAAFSRPRWRLAGATGLALSTAFGFAWLLSLELMRPPHGWSLFDRDSHDCLPPIPAPAEEAAIEFLRHRVEAGEGVFRSQGSEAYAVYGGLPQPASDWGTRGFGFGHALYEDRQRMMRLPDDPAVYLRQGFRWLVLSPHDGPAALRMARRWTEEKRADIVAEIPPLTIVRLR